MTILQIFIPEKNSELGSNYIFWLIMLIAPNLKKDKKYNQENANTLKKSE